MPKLKQEESSSKCSSDLNVAAILTDLIRHKTTIHCFINLAMQASKAKHCFSFKTTSAHSHNPLYQASLPTICRLCPAPKIIFEFWLIYSDSHKRIKPLLQTSAGPRLLLITFSSLNYQGRRHSRSSHLELVLGTISLWHIRVVPKEIQAVNWITVDWICHFRSFLESHV